ncbi:unnamed protein product [Rotaria sp. Silwood2]|nr:unnamed protein product [Rotaria sp. Silwood2]CAF3413068.1 unnamed protein product [Rotaria sp. Silwood2]CAF4310496.1 unnamed protein product [Rotaria sp. Silwood2]
MVKRCVVCLKQETRSNDYSFHRFPTDKNAQQAWLRLLNQVGLNDVSNRRVCSSHFDSSSFITKSSSKNGINIKNLKRLKRGALPMDLTTPAQVTWSSRSISTQTDLNFNDLSSLFEKLSVFEQKMFATTICIERFRHDDTNIRYYTGFRSYAIFMMVYELLQVKLNMTIILLYIQYVLNAHYHIRDHQKHICLRKKISFFLFMIRLRRATDEHELGIFFNISQTTVSRIIIAWTRFIYSVVSSISLWPSKEQVQQNLPFEIKKNYPLVRVIVDCTEFEIEQPTNPQAQQNTWSTYKNTNTAKALVGITPNGVVSYISPLYGGATSDRSLLNMIGAGSLIELMEPGDQIMSDRGFALDHQHSHLTLIHPPFLEGKSQLSPSKVIETRIIARHRIHVERCMGRIKNYKLLNGVIPMKSIYLLNYWFYICTFLTIFDEPLVKVI